MNRSAASSQGPVGSSIAHYGALDSLLNQAMYFGQSFGRIGADFRLALVPIFREVAQDIALNALQGADIKFAQGIDQLALKANVISTGASTSKNAEQGGVGLSGVTIGAAGVSNMNDDFSPPMSLLDFVPLAEFCNAILNSFNEIRLVTPLAIAPKVVKVIQSLLESAAKTLADR